MLCLYPVLRMLPGSEAVSSLSVTTITATEVTVTWTPPAATNGHLTAYVILLQDSQQLCVRLVTVFLDGVLSEKPVRPILFPFCSV